VLRIIASVVLAVLAHAATMQAVMAADPSSGYRVARRISGPDGRWDLVAVDSRTRRLYVGREGGILAVNLSDETVLPNLLAAPVVHQILPLEDGRLIVTTGESDTAVILDGATGQVIAEVPTGRDPDAIAFDRKTGLAMTFNRGGNDATILDVEKGRVTGGLKLPGKPESAVADGEGTMYVNIASGNEIAVIDVRGGRIIRRIALQGCEEPTGLALDATDNLLIAACDNGIAKVLTTGGRALADLAVGPEPDAAFVDSGRRLAFIPSGGDGTLTVISLRHRNHIGIVERVITQRGTRTGAVDPQTGTVFLPTGKLLPPTPPAKWPSVVPGSFEILVVERNAMQSSARPVQPTP